MKGIAAIARNTISEFSVYRLNFILWRFRVLIRFFITYFLWKSVFSSQETIGSYTAPQMLTYMLIGFVVTSLVMSSRTQDVGDQINNGALSNVLLRPYAFLSFLLGREIGDKMVNFVLSLIEVSMLFILINSIIFIQTNTLLILCFVASVCLAILMYFLMSLSLSFSGFWTNEVWAVRFTFFIVLEFFMGWVVPLDLFPVYISRIILGTPFPYLLFFPMKVYLGHLSSLELVQGFTVGGVWIVVLTVLAVLLWKKGLRRYGADGR